MAHGHPLMFGKDSDLHVGICPICNRRLTAECEHRTEETEAWLAAHLVAETNVSISDNEAEQLGAIMQWIQQDEETVPMNYVDTGKVLIVMGDPAWMQQAQAEHSEWLDNNRTQEDARY